ncbi:MAG: glycosyltransferase [Micropruina sp.]|uniref:glycosyltransferase family 2 protein n=1 Tax=Micropruina sp. TaxID=2737536 RepID=UPI0039E5969B
MTVITPAYNVADYIAEAVTSVLAQTIPDFTYLIVDDGSTDGTAEVAEAAAGGDPRVRIIRQENQGSSAARNTGISLATTPFIAFLDGDDRWLPETLRILIAAIDGAEPDVGAVFGHSRLIDEQGQLLRTTLERPPGRYDLSAMLRGMAPMGNGSCLLLRRSCFEEVGGFDVALRSAVDFEMWLRIQKSSTTPIFHCVPKMVVDYRIRPGSISTYPAHRFQALDRIFDTYAADASPADRVHAYVSTALNAYRAGDDLFGPKWLRSALRSAPLTSVRHPEFARALPWLVLGGRATRSLRRLISTVRSRGQSRP